MNQSIIYGVIFAVLIAGLIINSVILLEQRSQVVKLQTLLEEQGCLSYFETTNTFVPNLQVFNISSTTLVSNG